MLTTGKPLLFRVLLDSGLVVIAKSLNVVLPSNLATLMWQFISVLIVMSRFAIV